MVERLNKKIDDFHNKAEEIAANAENGKFDFSVREREPLEGESYIIPRPPLHKSNSFRRTLVARPAELLNGKSPFPSKRSYTGPRTIRTPKKSLQNKGGRRKTRQNRKHNRKSQRK
jgi:hypothetical protein